ncbi:unnamed protein product [Linum trigynum]|uniref:Uncharacterized protein n=1 Tax=Linum trigynum TaxID=586398 RepID=A0AAV2GMM3_9ROSI
MTRSQGRERNSADIVAAGGLLVASKGDNDRKRCNKEGEDVGGSGGARHGRAARGAGQAGEGGGAAGRGGCRRDVDDAGGRRAEVADDRGRSRGSGCSNGAAE